MRRLALTVLSFVLACTCRAQVPLVIDHTCTDLVCVPPQYIEQSRQLFRLSYGHTSHGSQIVSGMQLLHSSSGALFAYNRDGSGGALSLHDGIPSGDLGQNGDLAWAQATRELLQGSGDRNMVMWSWCGGCSTNTVDGIDAYLQAMHQLEADYPDVVFVYMTGHLDGSGTEGNLHQRNEQIRSFCRARGKVLFDFADIESFDPDGNAFLDRFANDNCDYIDADGMQRNWADEWCARNPGVCEDCSCAHSKCLNCMQKGKAFWWMMARLAGWEGPAATHAHRPEHVIELPTIDAIHPNPVSAQSTLRFTLPQRARVSLSMYDLLGRRVATIIEDAQLEHGSHSIQLRRGSVNPGAYLYLLTVDGVFTVRRVLLL